MLYGRDLEEELIIDKYLVDVTRRKMNYIEDDQCLFLVIRQKDEIRFSICRKDLFEE